MADPTLLTIDDWLAASAAAPRRASCFSALRQRLDDESPTASGSRAPSAAQHRGADRRARGARRRASPIAPRRCARCRCSACRSRSRTTSTSPACRPPRPARRSPTRRAAHAARGRAADRGRRGLRRQDQPRPVRDRPGRHALAVRPAEQRVRARSHQRRLELGLGGRRSRAATSPFALGTDTAGSGRVPAGFNNIVGLKPTPGRVGTARRRAGLPQPRLRVDLRADGRPTRRACSR